MRQFELDLDAKQKADLLKCNEVTLIGHLAVDRTTFPNGGMTKDVITPIKNGRAIMFYIHVLTEEPTPLARLHLYGSQKNLYIGLDQDQMKVIINDIIYSSRTEDEKIAHWNKRLQNKLIIFKPKITIGPNRFYLNLEIQNIDEFETDSMQPTFLSIPQTKMEQGAFEDKLQGGNYIILEDYVHVNPNPQYLICGEYLYYNFAQWQRHHTNIRAWRVSKDQESIMRIKLKTIQDELNDYIIEAPNKLRFLNLDAQFLLEKLLKKHGESILQTVVVYDESEADFLRELKASTLREGLFYHETDLLNFHVSMKTNALSVVAGMSGTGKTKLVRTYAKVLGLWEEDECFLFLPISPSYIEPTDILGQLNIETGLYVPSATGLVNLLVAAAKNPDKMYMVLFDEMNLSQVEHWFAPFLSLLEIEAENRWLHLYGRDYDCQNGHLYPRKVNIGDNVMFVGTVNLDETTKEFSDRVLDRMNVVTLKKGRFSQMKAKQEEAPKEKIFDYALFKQWRKPALPLDAFTESDLTFFDELHDLINFYDTQKGVSYRFLNRLGRYIHNIPEECGLNKGDAIDLGVKQGMLTKIKGSERQIGGLVGVMISPEEELINSQLLTLLQSEVAQRVSPFTEAQKELRRKALELGIYGYTS